MEQFAVLFKGLLATHHVYVALQVRMILESGHA